MPFNNRKDALDLSAGGDAGAQVLARTARYAEGSGATTVAADVLAIPVTHPVVTKTTGGDAEALTLADGEPGQVLHIHLGTDGNGVGTLTPTTKTGFTTIIFADVGDRATLQFIDSTPGWILLGATGVAAPPVTT